MDELLNRLLDASRYDAVKHKIMSEFYGNEEYRERSVKSKWVEDARKEQRADGSWGRFHTQDSRLKQKSKTTEGAVLRLKYLSMKRGDDTIDNACDYMEALLHDLSLWPDAWEKNKWFKPAVPLFIASKLALYGSGSPEYVKETDKWIHVLDLCLEGDGYNAQTTDLIAKEHLGVPIDGSYIGLNAINNLLLFSFNANRISADTQRKYVKWLHSNPACIGYTMVSLSSRPEKLTGNALYGYIRLLALLSAFDGYADEFADEIKWLERLQGSDGLWDFGKKVNIGLKLSDTWRSDMDRKIDCTVFVLSSLRGFLR